MYQDRNYGFTTNKIEETREKFTINLEVVNVNTKMQSTQTVFYVERTNSLQDMQNI